MLPDDFSRFGANLLQEHFSRFEVKVPHFSNKYPRVAPFLVSLISDASVAD